MAEDSICNWCGKELDLEVRASSFCIPLVHLLKPFGVALAVCSVMVNIQMPEIYNERHSVILTFHLAKCPPSAPLAAV